ncbi:DUF1854 domain-containing protein [Niveibacterium sp. SC-1]|uniref:cyanophycin metabolism-associated DUF1854 family protein n=1 Tax=Niveibacterium sp. SC-1 TaxID=3135646 RepID=UPI00311E80CC
MSAAFQLSRQASGRLAFVSAEGVVVDGVVPVRAFPIAAPDEGIALVAPDGHEVAWIDRIADLPGELAQLVSEELASREFMPQILKLKAVSTFATPSTWSVETDRGETRFILKGEEDIRRLAGNALLIADNHGVQYLIRDLLAMDRHSRRLLDRFL